MNRSDLERWEIYLDKEIVTRRGLGGYSPEATTILQLCLFCRALVQEALRQTPAPRPRKKKDEEE